MITQYRKLIFPLLLLAIVYGVFYYWNAPKYINGEKAPDFSYVDLDQNARKLSDFAGKWVLLDFWGSWCGPCRNSNKDLVQFYDEYKAKNIEIISIALEQNAKAWKKAMQADGLVWSQQYSDLKRMKSPIAQLYGVHNIPTLYLINPQGYIAAVNPNLKKSATETGSLRSYLNAQMDK